MLLLKIYSRRMILSSFTVHDAFLRVNGKNYS